VERCRVVVNICGVFKGKKASSNWKGKEAKRRITEII